MNLSKIIAAASLALPLIAQAGVIPSGIQSNITTATTTSWGWTECHRSGAGASVAISTIMTACKGDYLMMGYTTNATTYAILGAGAYGVVTKITQPGTGYANLNNWSNGLNFYRTSGNGSWGFTTNSHVYLSSADVFLSGGLQNYAAGAETVAARGLSFHANGPSVTSGWGYNLTGAQFVSMSNPGQRVFLTYTETKLPEPGVLLLLALGAAGFAASRRRA